MWVLIYAMCMYTAKACVGGEAYFDTKELCDNAVTAIASSDKENVFWKNFAVCTPAKLDAQ